VAVSNADKEDHPLMVVLGFWMIAVLKRCGCIGANLPLILGRVIAM